MQVGEPVIAIGSPFGLDQTVTQGIVSAVGRTWQPRNGQVRHGLIQTDAPINPGDSGSPLFNARGEVISIISMIESPVAGSVGVGFAIPINTAKRLLSQLEAGARLEPVWLGITGQEVDPAVARDQGLTVQTGILVGRVMSNGPAAMGGLRGSDVIMAIDGQPVRTMAELADRLSGHRPGDTLAVTINRAGQELPLRVTLQTWPADDPSPGLLSAPSVLERTLPFPRTSLCAYMPTLTATCLALARHTSVPVHRAFPYASAVHTWMPFA